MKKNKQHDHYGPIQAHRILEEIVEDRERPLRKIIIGKPDHLDAARALAEWNQTPVPVVDFERPWSQTPPKNPDPRISES